MTDESQSFQIVWTLPNGSHVDGAGIFDTMEEGQDRASEMIRNGSAPSHEYRIRLRVPKPSKPKLTMDSVMDVPVVGPSYDAQAVREFFDFIQAHKIPCFLVEAAESGAGYVTNDRFDLLLAEWQAIRTKASRERIFNLIKKNLDDPAQP